MDDVLHGIDFSEIINEEDDSWAFVDSNILESARQELDDEKFQRQSEYKSQNIKAYKPVKERNEEHKSSDNQSDKEEVYILPANLNDEEPKNNGWEHNGIKPVFDWLYCAKTNVVVDKLIHNNLVSKYKDNEMTSLELSIKSKKFENMYTWTNPNLFQSTAVSAGHARSSSALRPEGGWKFYSLSNSIAKIKFENQNTFDGNLFRNSTL